MFASSITAIMATVTSAGNIIMAEYSGNPGNSSMAGITLGTGVYVPVVFSRCTRTIMTGTAGNNNGRVIHICSVPGKSRMTIVTGRIANDVSGVFSRSNLSIMATITVDRSTFKYTF